MIHEDRQGALRFGTEGGLAKYAAGRFTAFTLKDGLANERVWSIHEDTEGVLWLGTFDLIESQESERKRIAAELHDGLGQSLVIIKNRALHSLTEPEDHDRAIEQIEEIADAATHAILEAREIAYNLRPFHIDRLGLTTALGAMIKRASNDRLRFTTELDSIDGLLAPEQEINFYRIVQECLNNILKHSAASEASVTIKRHDQMIELTVQDNGRGFTPSVRHESSNGSGFGLLGLTERARILGGALAITSTPGHGTITQLKLPVSFF